VMRSNINQHSTRWVGRGEVPKEQVAFIKMSDASVKWTENEGVLRGRLCLGPLIHQRASIHRTLGPIRFVHAPPLGSD